LHLSFGLGITKKLGNDIYLFSLLHGGIINNLHPYTYPEFGLMIYEIANMKSILTYKHYFYQNYSYNNIDIYQNIFIKKNFRLGLHYNLKYNNNFHKENLSLSLNMYL